MGARNCRYDVSRVHRVYRLTSRMLIVAILSARELTTVAVMLVNGREIEGQKELRRNRET